MGKYLFLVLCILITVSNYAQNVGINTLPSSPPTNTLDVNGTLRVRGGTPGAGKVFTSDANGVGSWTAPSGIYPRITYDAILALPSPILGDMAYDITFRCLRVYNGDKWFPTYRTPDDNNPEITLLATQGDLPNAQVGSQSITTDASGNIYIAGEYYGATSFGNNTITSVNNDNYDIFLAKYTRDGTLAWVQSAGGSSFDGANSIAVDATGNVYITGSYSGTATFGSTATTSVGFYDIFVAKYNSNGVLQWVESAGGSEYDYGNSIAVDGAGNAYITGSYRGNANFGAITKTSTGFFDIFVAKYNGSGTVQWVQSAGGSAGSGKGTSIAVDVSGNIYITGDYSGTVSFGTISKTALGGHEIFITKYDPVGGTWLWVQSAGGSSDDFSTSIALDNLGYLCITGYYYGNCTFGSTTITSAGIDNGYIAKYSINGTLSWVKNLSSTSFNYGRSVAFDAVGNIYVTGTFNGTSNFDAIAKTSAGYSDIFIAKYNANGNAQWVQTVKSTLTSFNPSSNSTTVDSANNVYTTGAISLTFTFGNFTKTVTYGIVDSYIARLK